MGIGCKHDGKRCLDFMKLAGEQDPVYRNQVAVALCQELPGYPSNKEEAAHL